MGPTIMDPGKGGGGREDIGLVLPSGSPGYPYIWVGDMGCDPPHGEDPGGGFTTRW